MPEPKSPDSNAPREPASTGPAGPNSEGPGQTAETVKNRGTSDPKENPRPGRLAAFKATLTYAKPHKLTFIGIFFCSLIAIVAELLQPYLVKIAIDDHLFGGSGAMRPLVVIGLFYLGLSVVNFAFTYVQNNLLQYAGQSIVASIRKNLFAHISKLSMSFFDRYPIGSLVTLESSDTETISQFFTQVFLSLVRDGMTLVLIIFFMFQLDATLALYSLLLLPVIALIAVLFRSMLRKAYQETRAQLSRLIAYLAENLAGMSLIQTYNQQDEQFERFSGRNGQYLKANLKEIRTNVLFNRSFDIFGNISVALLVWLGGLAFLGGSIEFGVLYAFITYIRQFFQPINQITQQWNTLQSTSVSMERLWNILSTEPDVKEPADEEKAEIDWKKTAGKIDYNHVDFSYVEGSRVLRDLDLHIKPGEMIGIVGTTGAGKSSLISLLTRFYDVNAGSVMIDGTDIRRIPQDTLHRMIGLVQQEPYLYSGTILDNVRLFRQEISREEVTAACRAVGAHPLITRLKDGYDTKLSERGSGLSAGERQLLSFARILVFKPRILILDEATANLDSHTEQLVQKALAVVSEGRTSLIIAHRLSTIMHADRIIVMKHGEIVEEGSHRQLLAKKGTYEELYRHSQGMQAIGS
ncbi:ABC transporter ATP-binding protein [Paenibacillus sp. UNC499MF]|uniref:ABC transporter ATP-binding protein n=1 Tax=Paenibacillus sp. UNC499MF TaxID=1502751 RepID=UPI00089F9606|nr:ABC transporter ATP-binding protein [Paenibacillus sp. UNC499MF]SEG17478.1 ATP-binding cassette, subfamily B [Paenibacillus sp. UNC499MF]